MKDVDNLLKLGGRTRIVDVQMHAKNDASTSSRYGVIAKNNVNFRYLTLNVYRDFAELAYY